MFTTEELELIYMSLLVAGKGRIPNTTIVPEKLESEYEIKARQLAKVVGSLLKTRSLLRTGGQ